MLTIINQIWEINSKANLNGYDAIQRNLRRLDAELIELGYTIIDPIGRSYKETDTDIEANISGSLTNESKIVKVLKPIVYLSEKGQNVLVQKGIAIVE